MMSETMRPIRETIPLSSALALLLEAAVPIERRVRVPLDEAAGRVISTPPVASLDVPPFDRAAMDGYAVRAEDTFGAGRYDPRALECVDKVFTGQVLSRSIEAGQCVEIATGAPMPDGADAVVMVEETERVEETRRIRVFSPVYPRQNVGRRGTDITAGQAIVQPGDLLIPGRLGALAAIGAADVDVFAKPEVAILSTGNEIVAPGRPLEPGQIYDINRYTLSSIVAAHGGVPMAFPTAPDTLEALMTMVDRAVSHDMVIFSGGSSVGEHDLIVDVLSRRGEIVFHGVAVKPGKPTIFGRINGTPVLGMPGNPTSCLSNSYMLLIPMLRKIARLPEFRPQIATVPLARRIVSTTGRHQFYTVRLVDGEAQPAFKGSGDITSMSLADGYLEIPAHVDIVEAGELVDVKLF